MAINTTAGLLDAIVLAVVGREKTGTYGYKITQEVRTVLASALLAEYGHKTGGNTGEMAAFLGKNLTKAQIMHTIEILQNYRRQCQYNVSAGQVLGALTVELEGIL